MPEGLEQWRANSGSRLTAADELVVSSAREIIRSVVDIDEAKKAERQRRFDAAQACKPS